MIKNNVILGRTNNNRKAAMFTFIFIIIITVLTFRTNSQTSCDPLLNSMLPPSPYADGYLTFDGRGDFLRTSDLNQLEFPYETTDSFTISTRLKIDQPYKPMNIFGKYRSAGWIVGYHNNEYGYLSIYINNTWKRIYYLGSDTSWHDYELKFDKSSQTLRTFVDGNQTNLYTNFTYSDMTDVSAFSVGNVGFFAQYGPQSVNVSSYWFKGSIAMLRIDANLNSLVNYGFNEGGGQVARDSIAYFYSDRTYPGSSTCGRTHLMLGYMPAEDTCDPVWSAFDEPVISRFSSLGSGTQYFVSNNGMEYFAEHFSTALTVHSGMLTATGSFNLAGGVPANRIAAWNGSQWSPLGSGLNHEALALVSFNGELYSGGFFDTAGGTAAKYIAKWNGTNWQQVGEGFNSIVNTLFVFNGQLIAGGWFTSSGNTIIQYTARLNNNNEWEPMSTGMSGPVYTFCKYRGELYAGGSFTTASGEPAGGIARWDGFKWNAVGTGVLGGDKTVYTLAVYDDKLYAGGSFIKMNSEFCYNIAKYDGTSWSAAGSGATGALCNQSQGYVSSLKVLNNTLYAAGQFSYMNGMVANKLARFNGLDWCSVEYGVDLRPRALEVYNNDLIIAGDFHSASGVAANNIVKYTPKPVLTGITGNTLPREFKLEQNYPNPFNPKTNIKFNIADISFVTLKVFDITGREAAILLNDNRSEGIYNIGFDASGFASGIYIYRLEAVNRQGVRSVQSRKMVLIK